MNTAITKPGHFDKDHKKEISLKRKYLREQNAKFPITPVQIPDDQWPKLFESDKTRIAVWRSREFLVQVFRVHDALTRLSICRTEIDDAGNWKDHITWDELMWLKEHCGYADKDAVEVFPRKKDVVNVANMRHLWVFDELQPYVWRDRPESK